MSTTLSAENIRGETICKIEEVSAQNLYRCYQCAKCSAACPATEEMDMMPNEVIRYLQLGMVDKVMQANTPWICATCLQCMSTCPKGVDLSRIMEAVRMIQLRRGDSNEIDIADFDEEYRKRAPQIALISAYRKFLSLS